MEPRIFDLTGKVALITGASSGLGRHFSKTLSEAGATVILSARRVDNLIELQNELKGNSHVFSLDVTSNESVENLFQEIKNEFGSADILINNAGVNDTRKFKDLDEESWNFVLETNLNGAFRVAKSFTDLLLEQNKPGSVINIASILGLRVGLNLTSYAAAKAGVMALTRCAAIEAAEFGVRVNAVSPSFASHPFLEKVSDPDLLKGLESQEAFGRGAQPWEVANVIVFLASDLSSYMTGESVSVSSQRA